MSAYGLSSRAIIGEFYARLEQDIGQSWVPSVSMLFDSDQDSETYKWLGQSPAMRQWVGGRNTNGLRENGVVIPNIHYEATMDVLVREARRDKTGQVLLRIRNMAERANAHWASLLSTLIVNGASTACYDGKNFFATDHTEGASGTQSNSISVDISALPTGDTTGSHGSTTAPSVGEMALSIQQGIQQIIGFLDDKGEPMNELAQQFIVMVPSSLLNAANAACAVPFLPQGMNNTLVAGNAYSCRPVANVRLNSSWTTKFAVFRVDGSTKPFIRQEETPVRMSSKAEGSEYEHDNDAWQFGIDTWRGVGYGFWQQACLVTMT